MGFFPSKMLSDIHTVEHTFGENPFGKGDTTALNQVST